MTGSLKEGFKKTSGKALVIPVIAASDGLDQAYLKLKPLLRRKWPTLSADAQRVVSNELQRLKTMGTNANEYGSTLDYITNILSLPWAKTAQRKVNLKTASRKLDATHFGMDKTKEKCIEFIATLNSSGKAGGALCLDGPPGVGKTSVAESIATAMGRKYAKVSMAGVSDQTHIRGHRRTYSGALPGAIIEAIKKAGTTNPIIILDEGDKAAGAESKSGNPTYAMLELLDPGQNATFKDHYLDLEFDLSDVLFIMTTNDVSVLPSMLVDRMEIISVGAYTTKEKIHIAENYLLPKHLQQCGIAPEQLLIQQDALHKMIEEYTSESGVRRLEQCVKDICRKTNVALQKGMTESALITADNLGYLLGPPRVYKTLIPTEDKVGLTTGLYFADNGGGIIPIQVITRLSDKFNVSVTGLPGKMIEESVKYATEMIRGLAGRYNIDTTKLDKTSIHVHLVDGASPKDGPSAGIAITSAIISSLLGIKARHEVAMTGEVDLHGNVLPIGGVKEKLEGARKAGATTVIIPAANERDLFDVPQALKDELNIIPVKHIDEVLMYALTEAPMKPQMQLASAITAANQSQPPSPEEIERVVRYMTDKPEMIDGAIKKLTAHKYSPS